MLSREYQLNFQGFLEILTNNKIPFCVVAGTLLGAVREGKFLNHDLDVDIGIPLEYKQQVLDVLEKTDWFIYCLWRRELGVIRYGFSKLNSKVDIFFLESDEKNTYIYSYKRNPLHGIWDIEWRMGFPKEYFAEFKPYQMSDIPIFIPVGYEKILELEYGDWKTEKQVWNHDLTPCLDKNHREIAIIIPNFLRNEKLIKTVESIQNTFHKEWYRLYIADQGFFDAKMNEYYKSLTKQGHFATYIPFNSGLSFSRNYLINKTTEPFIFLIDNDFIISQKTNISNFINILNSDDSIGVVGGNLTGHDDYHYDLYLKDGNIYYVRTKPVNNKTIKSFIQPTVCYEYCDIVLNFALFKKEVFNQIQWDEELKLSEHSDFYLSFKNLTNWRVAHTNSVVADHSNVADSADYVNLRRMVTGDIYYKAFLKKRGIGGDKNIIKLGGDK
jgi:phosphorylcholine metabolism protein LicD